MAEAEASKQFGFEEVPEGADRITEDEFERLPEYVVELINKSAKGELAPCTHEQLVAESAAFFENSVTPVAEPVAEVAVTEVAESDHERDGGCDPVPGGEVPASE